MRWRIAGARMGSKAFSFWDPNRFANTNPTLRAGRPAPAPGGVADYPGVAATLVREITDRGGEIRSSSKVTSLQERGRWRIETSSGEYEADFIINCAGLHCDRISRLGGGRDPAKIVPFRGEYYDIRPERQYLVRNLIYPVPDPKFPFLGVHFTRMIRGGIEADPNAVLAFAREGYRKSDVSVRDTLETLTYPGFWRFLLRYPSMCWHEFRRSWSKQLFCQSLQRLVPEIRMEDLTPGASGVRAQALDPSGGLIQGFRFVSLPNALHVLNAPSPAVTASMAIADEVVNMVQDAVAA